MKDMSRKVTLYIGYCPGSGKRYFGKTTKYHTQEELQSKYWGSGPEWIKHYHEWGDPIMSVYWTGSESEVEKIALDFSRKNKIVVSEMWLNQKEENGLDGFNNKGIVVVKDKEGNKFQVSVDDPRYLSGELTPVNKGMVAVKNKKGNRFQVSVNDPRYLPGELVPIHKGKVVVKDKEGNRFQVSVDNPRYVSGELVPVNKGAKRTDAQIKSQKKKMKEKVHIHNENKSKMVTKWESIWYIADGWIPGRMKGFQSSVFHIFDADHNLIYEVEDNFQKFCKENDLPGESLRISYNNGGIPIFKDYYTNNRVKAQVDIYNRQKYVGWYAIKVKAKR